MIANKYTLIFLACAAALALGSPVQEPEKKLGIQDFFTEVTQKIKNAISETYELEKDSIEEVKESLDETLKKLALTAIGYGQAGIEYWSIPVKMLNNLIHKDDSYSYVTAISEPVQNFIDSVRAALNSTQVAYSSFQNTTQKAAKAYFDVSFAFPQFGLNLMGEKGDEVKEVLQDGYDRYKDLLQKAADDYKRLGKSFATTGYTMFQTFANSTIIPQVAKILQSATNGTLKHRFDVLSNGTLQARDYALKVAHNLTQGGIFFNKAGYDLEVLLQKYSLNLITEDEAKDYAQVLNQHMNVTRESIEKAQEAFGNAFDGVLYLFEVASQHGKELKEALEYIKKNIKDDDPIDLEISRNITLATVQSTIKELGHMGELLAKAGTQMGKAGSNVASIIPKFGLSVLKKRAEDLGEKFIAFVGQVEEKLKKVVDRFVSVGENVIEGGEAIQKSSIESEEVLLNKNQVEVLEDEFKDLFKNKQNKQY